MAAALAESPRARNWLDLGALLDACLLEARAVGTVRVTRDCVAGVLGAAAPAPAPVSDRDITRFLGGAAEAA